MSESFNISVIIPVYNAQDYIEKAISSCLSIANIQEIIVVDDGYPDNAYEIVKKLSVSNSKIKLFTHPNHENKGAGATRNLGIEKATQDYIAFLDADDFYLPHRFEKDKQVFLQNADADGCYNAIGTHFYSEKAKQIFQSSFGTEKTTVNPKFPPTPENLFDGLLGILPQFGYFHLDGTTMKKESLKKIQPLFNPELKLHQDTELLIRLSYHTKLFPSELEIPVAMRGIHEENRITANNTGNITKRYKNRFLMWKSLQVWSANKTLKKDQKNYISKQYRLYKMLAMPHKKSSFLLKEIVKDPSVLKDKNYEQIHKHFFGHLSYSHILYRIRNFIIKYF